MNTTIKCPKCGEEIEIAQILREQIEVDLKNKFEEKRIEDMKKIRSEAEENLKKEIEERGKAKLDSIKELLEEKTRKLEEAQKEELILRRMKNSLEEEKRSFDLKFQREIDRERDMIRQKALEESAQQQKMREREKDKVIEDLKKSLDDAQRKANQGSQQLQGEVGELDLEETLRSSFPPDTIEPVGKGVKGADVRQIVRTQRGNICGVILWESKRTKQWTDEWITKLKEDLRAEKANIPVIISTALPSEASEGIGFKDGVWICSQRFVIPLADMIRQRLRDVAWERFVSQNKGGKAEQVYEYVTSHEFIQQVEAVAEIYRDIMEQIHKEQASYERSWKTREAQAQRLLKSAAGIWGSMRGYIGSSLPMLKGLDTISEEASDTSVE